MRLSAIYLAEVPCFRLIAVGKYPYHSVLYHNKESLINEIEAATFLRLLENEVLDANRHKKDIV